MKNKTILLILAGLLSACVQMTPVDEYVVLKHRLTEANAEEVERLSRQVIKTNDNNPDLDSQIRHALVLCAPGRSEKELVQARQIFDRVLTFSGALSPSIRDFVELNRREIDQRLLAIKTEKESAQLVESLQDEHARLQSEIRSLRQDLAETNKKIKALKTIEESIDRSNKLEIP